MVRDSPSPRAWAQAKVTALARRGTILMFVFFLLKISAKFLIACNLIAHMDANGDLGAGFVIAFIKSSSALYDGS